jgi:hypothetical protein
MKQKQNVVVQWCLVILAGMFSLGSLLLFWKQDVIIAQGSVENPQVEGFDNKVEYLYTLTFVRENYNSNLQTRSIR